MIVEIITPDKTLYSGELKLVQLPGIDGSFEIMDNHAPMVAVLKKGKIKLLDGKDKAEFMEIEGGVLEVRGNIVKILAD
jgi:F-type H+-transporting ATPase subunit epsilon